MSYVALYRKYRPNTFEGILGQENVTKILQNQIRQGKISHAYIFSGSRGTGKTTAAKVFARAINCLNPHDGEPCNECEVCKNIIDGNTTDVIEMDAASNNSVENIRQIRQEVVYATIDVKYRVYIIDEAHMLTTSAFNALLKTLEEPPENVVFILATTEQHKIPVTILSRCLRFEFNRLSESEILERLEYVMTEEGLKYEEKALKYIAKLADGGMRDALSILERCISESQNLLQYDNVLKIVGAIDATVISLAVDSVINLNTTSVLEIIDGIVEKGKDLRQFTSQITEEFLNRLIQSKDNEKQRYINIIDRLSKLDNDIRLSSKPVIVLKSALVELCNIDTTNTSMGENKIDVTQSDLGPLLIKITNLEKEINILKQNMVKKGTEQDISNVIPRVSNKISKNETNNEINISSETLEPFVDVENFKQYIVEHGKLKLYSSLASAKLYTTTEALVIVTTNSFAYSILTMQESIETMQKLFEECYGEHKNIVIRLEEEKDEVQSSKIEKVLNQNEVNYTPID